MGKEILHRDFEFEKASKSLRKLLYEIAEIKIKPKRSFVYEGPDILSSSVLACNPNIKETFTSDMIKYHRERGRDKIDLFIMNVFQLGYSVGTEIERAKYQDFTELMKLLDSKEK